MTDPDPMPIPPGPNPNVVRWWVQFVALWLCVPFTVAAVVAVVWP
jgi:hypothetical protein